MATEAIKSTTVTNLDGTPPKRSTTGQGGQGMLRFNDEKVSFADAVTLGSTYRAVRVPSQAIVKIVRACVDAAVTTFTVDIGVYYTTGADIPAGVSSGAVISAALFGSAVALATIVNPTDYTRESGTLTVAKMFMPLWQAAGLTSDPKCGLDIVLTNTATNIGAGTVYLSVEYILPM